ncbi:MAG: dihydroorotate dehydrogenase [Chloroflexi bacterium]|nr:dihydroorotate dehydrogenase [Chloroflexota bacterium]
MNLAVELAANRKRGLLLPNPVMAASGTFGYGTEYARFVDIQKLGAIICKGTTLRARRGNPQPRLVETACGVLNSIGLQNIGVKALIRQRAPIWSGWRAPVIVNIAGEHPEEYARLAAMLEDVPGVSGIEVNISCPNVARGGMTFGALPELAAEVTAAVREATTLPMMVKLSPNVGDIVAVAQAVEEAGADAISLTNTFVGMAIDVTRRRPVFANVVAGLSGPAIKPLSLHMVYRVAGAVKASIVGCGGISTASDALEFIMAGAVAVQVGTANFVNPRVCLDIIEGIERFMEEAGIGDIKELVGAARPKGKGGKAPACYT